MPISMIHGLLLLQICDRVGVAPFYPGVHFEDVKSGESFGVIADTIACGSEAQKTKTEYPRDVVVYTCTRALSNLPLLKASIRGLVTATLKDDLLLTVLKGALGRMSQDITKEYPLRIGGAESKSR